MWRREPIFRKPISGPYSNGKTLGKLKNSKFGYFWTSLMDCVWDTSKYDPKLSVSICHSMSRGQGKFKLKILCLGRVIHVFRSFFSSRTRKNDPKTFFRTAQIGQNLKIMKMWKFQGTAWKMVIFDLQKAISWSFFKIST